MNRIQTRINRYLLKVYTWPKYFDDLKIKRNVPKLHWGNNSIIEYELFPIATITQSHHIYINPENRA